MMLGPALLLRCAVIMLAGASLCFGNTGPAQTESDAATPQGYPVTLGDTTIFYVKAGIKATTPEERARTLSERLKRLANDPAFRTDSLGVADSGDSTDVVAGETAVMSVSDADALAEGRGRQEITVEYAERIRAAVEQYRRERSAKSLLTSSLLALLTTIAFITALCTLQKLHSRAQSKLPLWVNAKLGSSPITKYELIRPGRVTSGIVEGVKLVRLVIVLALFYVYLELTLSLFPRTRGVASKLFDHVEEPISRIGAAVWAHVPALFFVVVMIVIARYVLKVMRAFFAGIEGGAIVLSGFYPDWAMPTYKILRIVVIAFVAVIAYPYIPGSESDAFKGVSIFFGVLVSLGSTSLVSNIVAGLTMTYMRAFKIGDRVKISDFTGDVVKTRLQVTHLRTIKNEEIIVPNSMIINSHVINYSSMARDRGLILHTTVGVGYDAPWRQVRAMLLLAAEKTPGVLREPPPFVWQRSLDEFSVTYELNVYTAEPQQMGRIYSDLHKNVLDLFNEYEVQIMTPSYEGDREAPAIVPKDRWYAAPADRFDDTGGEVADK